MKIKKVFFIQKTKIFSDQFLLEPNGVARYQGRKKDLIIRGGENIFPKEIEDCLDQHESILESHVSCYCFPFQFQFLNFN